MKMTLYFVKLGEFKLSDDADATITTVLGSCVSTCLFDPVTKIGGMNHFLLPGLNRAETSDIRYGVNAMELLINALRKHGADNNRLQAKLFGGASVLGHNNNIGKSNGEFARDFLRTEGVEIVNESLGGQLGRKIRFQPTTGRVFQQMLEPSVVVTPKPAEPEAESGTITLFES